MQLSDADPSVGRSRPDTRRSVKKSGVQLAHLRQRTPFALTIDLARVGLLELGGQVAIDLKADADFHESGVVQTMRLSSDFQLSHMITIDR